jgi:hypothetical protein
MKTTHYTSKSRLRSLMLMCIMTYLLQAVFPQNRKLKHHLGQILNQTITNEQIYGISMSAITPFDTISLSR